MPRTQFIALSGVYSYPAICLVTLSCFMTKRVRLSLTTMLHYKNVFLYSTLLAFLLLLAVFDI